MGPSKSTSMETPCSQLTVNTLVIEVVLVSLLLTLNIFQTLLRIFHCELWSIRYRLVWSSPPFLIWKIALPSMKIQSLRNEELQDLLHDGVLQHSSRLPNVFFQRFIYHFKSFSRIPPTHKQFQMAVAIISGRANMFNSSNISSKVIIKLIYQHFINIIDHNIGRSVCILNNKFMLLETRILLQLPPFIFPWKSNSREVFFFWRKKMGPKCSHTAL